MDEQLIAAAKEEMRLHSVKFTMDDIARKLHISKVRCTRRRLRRRC